MFKILLDVIQIRKEKRTLIFERAKKYAKEYEKFERKEIDLKRSAKKNKNYYVPGEAKLAFVVRIRGYVLSSLYVYKLILKSKLYL